MIQSFVSLGWTTVIWYICGYSMCFSGSLAGDAAHGGRDFFGIVGNFDMAVLRGLTLDMRTPDHLGIPLIVFIAYQ